jgi:GH18 family chitinase
LLNFEEEPKYDYLIEELKKAYISAMQETNEKVSLTSAFRNPVFDWNVSLATRFQKIQCVIDDHWKEGETVI